MKSSFACSLSIALLSSVAMTASACVQFGYGEIDASKTASVGSRWLIRYFIHVDDFSSLKIGQEVVEEKLHAEQERGETRTVLPFHHLFVPKIAVRLPPINFAIQELGIVQIEFDRGGRVTTGNTIGAELRGEFDDRNYLLLVPQRSASGPPYRLADRFRGWSDPMREFTPAFCAGGDSVRYRKRHANAVFGITDNFGCREWSYQLLDETRPYIDVTSYERKESVMREFYGWAPFDGPRKPVIGMHNSMWVCLLDCPQGAAPGIIPDIAKWCRENGYPIPKRPKKNPMFPDADFPYDYEE
ncbi:MAG TPA: hypothetical protein VGC21_07845 [Telluria sp.]|jgi:hypothetical protein